MSIQICYRPPAHLHTMRDAVLGLRANRSNRWWWQSLATGMSIAEANAEIGKRVATCFGNDYSYSVDLRTLGADWTQIKPGIGETLARQGDEPGVIEFCHITGGGNTNQWTWTVGDEPMEYWMTAERLRGDLIEIVHNCRMDYFREYLEEPKPEENWFRNGNDPTVAAVYHRAEAVENEILTHAYYGDWQKCYDLVSGFRWPLRNHQKEADPVWSGAEYVLRQWLRETTP